mmetsp:Transcript_18447/g.16316  ORF Transcript_18447/g.16316 Transcript_18447/m.16316 type:complete len:135 (-) Transcript_18447:983-1387(-)
MERNRLMLINSKTIPDLEVYENSTQQKLPDSRVITISFTTLQLLHSLGVLEKMNHMLITPFRKMFVNEIFGNSYMAFDDDIIDSSYLAQLQQKFYDELISNHNYHFIGKNALGASVEYNHIQSALYSILQEQDK